MRNAGKMVTARAVERPVRMDPLNAPHPRFVAEAPERFAPGTPGWPEEFAHVDPMPQSIWLRGRLDLLAVLPRVAIVGTRAPTPYGEVQARRFATALARAGVCIVSGLARGIDACAHRAALEAGGATIAVLGCGVDRPWPASALADRIALEGLLLSEFEPGRGPRRHHFPLRNRLIAGLAERVLVVEAAQASGSLITARWAADQGKDVHALPGRVDHPMARGAHRLIREGAELIEDPHELIAALGLEGEPDTESEADHARDDAADGPEARAILDLLVGETLRADEIAERCAVPFEELLSALARMELSGAVVRGPGGLYRLPG